LTVPGELVVDPYCGSGTTLVESVLLGRRAVGIDLSPLAVLIARTKVTPIPIRELYSLRRELARALAHLKTADDMPLFATSLNGLSVSSGVQHDPRLNDEWFSKWFKREILEELLAIDHAIRRINDVRRQNVAWVAFSDILRKSSNAHSGYPNVMFDKNAPQRSRPIKPFLNALDRVCGMIASLEKTDGRWQDVRVEHGSATALPLQDSSVDAIVSHPPYIGSIPYAEYGAMSLKWLGTDPKELDKQLTGGRRQTPDVVERFRESYGRMLLEASRVLRPGRHLFLMVGNPIVRGEIVDLAAMTVDLAESAGFQLLVCADRKGMNRRANKMGAEHLLFFNKPSSHCGHTSKMSSKL
jgi:site-specific DNA-methyltransferase (cytosine-N4-specific)